MRKPVKFLLPCLLTCLAVTQAFSPPAAGETVIKALYRTDADYSDYTWWSPGVGYPRIICLQHSFLGQNNVLLATCEESNPAVEPGYPILRSLDQGKTWQRLSVVHDKTPGYCALWQPTLFELPRDFGPWKAGTILLAGASVDPAHTQRSAISLYASTDGGVTWNDRPAVLAKGGGPGTGVWEPFLVLLDDGTLVCYYSDETESEAHSQKLVYQTSADGITWSDPVDITDFRRQRDRPGMPVVTRLGDGTYFMTYEMVGRPGNIVTYRTSADGLDWGDPASIGTSVESTDFKMLGSAPYCNWTPAGSDKGTLIVSGTFMAQGSSSTGTDYFLSHDYGKTWTTIPHIIPYEGTHIDHSGYSNSMVFSADGKVLYALNNPPDPNIDNIRCKIVFALAELVPGAASLPENMPSFTDPDFSGTVIGASSAAPASGGSGPASLETELSSAVSSGSGTGGGRAAAIEWAAAAAAVLAAGFLAASVAFFMKKRKA